MVKVSLSPSLESYLLHGDLDFGFGIVRRNGIPERPNLKQAIGFDAKKGTLKLSQPGATLMGFKLPFGTSWRDVFAIVTPTHLYCFSSLDEPTKSCEISVRLQNCKINEADRETGRLFSFSIDTGGGSRLIFGAEDYVEYARWTNALYQGTEPFKEQIKQHVIKQVVKMQAYVRMRQQRRRFLEWRHQLLQISFDKHRREKAARSIQRFLRRKWAIAKLLRIFRAIALTQRLARRWIARRKLKQLKQEQLIKASAIIIQSAVRRWIAQRQYFQMRLEKNIAKHQKRRTAIAQEILSTEESYIRDLETIVKVFLKPLRALFPSLPPLNTAATTTGSSSSPVPSTPSTATPPPTVSPQTTSEPASKTTRHNKTDSKMAIGSIRGKSDRASSPAHSNSSEKIVPHVKSETTLKNIFCNIESIHAVHVQTLPLLQASLANWSEKTPIADFFIELAAQASVYIPYCNNYDTALQSLEAARKNEKFKQFLETASKVQQVKRLDLDGFLILPIQRLPRYILLLRDFIKHTWKDHPDRAGLCEALEKIQEATKKVNEAKKQAQNRLQMAELQRKFLDPNELQNLVIDDDVICNFEGPVLSQIIGEEEKTKAYALLFPDILVIAKRTTDRTMVGLMAVHKSYRFSDAVPLRLSEITVSKSFHDDCAILVESKKLSMMLLTKTSSQANEWVKQLQQAQLQFTVSSSKSLTSLPSATPSTDS